MASATVTVKFEELKDGIQAEILTMFADAVDELAAEYLATLGDSEEVEMYLTPREYAELVLHNDTCWYDGPGFVEWVKRKVIQDAI